MIGMTERPENDVVRPHAVANPQPRRRRRALRARCAAAPTPDAFSFRGDPPARRLLGRIELERRILSNTALFQWIQDDRAPVSPSGMRRTRSPSVCDTVRNTSSADVKPMLPTR